MDKIVCISGSIHEAATKMLRQSGCTVEQWSQPHRPSPMELVRFCKKADGLISLWTDHIDKHMFQKCPNIQVVCNYAAGYNNLNLEEATRHRVALCHTPGVLTEATADLTLALMLSLARKVVGSNKFIREGKWTGFVPMGHLGMSLRRKTLGIVGMGQIGAEVARLCHRAFDMSVLYVSRSEKMDIENTLSARRVGFGELLEKSDVVSAHVDLNASTRHMFNHEAFCAMQQHSLFINTARGEVHHEQDLIKALLHQEIGGAALDVCDPEPMQINNPLLQMDNVVVTPHIGSATDGTRRKMAEMAAQNVLQALQGHVPEYCLNNDVFENQG